MDSNNILDIVSDNLSTMFLVFKTPHDNTEQHKMFRQVAFHV